MKVKTDREKVFVCERESGCEGMKMGSKMMRKHLREREGDKT